jgi:ABC-type transport system involved in Fe-S cluster assembly fused permease/ATPase subunit
MIAEEGTTGELLDRGGLYAEMSRMQRLQKELG